MRIRYLWLSAVLFLYSIVCRTDDFSENISQEAEFARKQAEVEMASHNIWLRLRYGLADWLPWIAGAALLFVIWKWVLKRCPQCQRRFPKQIAGHTVMKPTETESGLAIITYRCRGCGHEWEFRRYLSRISTSRITPSSSSHTGPSSSSSKPPSSFGGFGGGSSGGGGTTRGY